MKCNLMLIVPDTLMSLLLLREYLGVGVGDDKENMKSVLQKRPL